MPLTSSLDEFTTVTVARFGEAQGPRPLTYVWYRMCIVKRDRGGKLCREVVICSVYRGTLRGGERRGTGKDESGWVCERERETERDRKKESEIKEHARHHQLLLYMCCLL